MPRSTKTSNTARTRRAPKPRVIPKPPPTTPEPEPEVEVVDPPATTPVVTATTPVAANTSPPPGENKVKRQVRLRSLSASARSTPAAAELQPQPQPQGGVTRARSRSVGDADRPEPAALVPDPHAGLRLDLGDETFERVRKLPLDLGELPRRPGLRVFLKDKLKTDADVDAMTRFLRRIAGTPAMDLAPESLDFLFARDADLEGNLGLQDFLVTKLRDATPGDALAAFHAEAKGLGALSLAADRLDFLFARRGALKGKVGLSTLMVARLRAGEDPAELDAFHRDVEGSAAEAFSAGQLELLYDLRAELRLRAGLKAFLIARLGAGEDVQALAAFHRDTQDPELAAFDAAQLDFLYDRRVLLWAKEGLRRFVIARLGAQGDDAELGDFLRALAGSEAEDLPPGKIEYLFELRTDLGKAATVATPSGYVDTTVRDAALARMAAHDSLSEVKAQMVALARFGYNERLQGLARGYAAKRGDAIYAAELKAVSDREAQEIRAEEDRLATTRPPPPGEEPSLKGRKERRAHEEWAQRKKEYDEFPTKTLPGLKAAVPGQIRPKYDPEREALAQKHQAGEYAAPELDTYERFVAAETFHADAEWAIAAAAGNLAQAKILLDACKGSQAMKDFGAWAAKQGHDDHRLAQTLQEAASLPADLEKQKLVAPYLVSNNVSATQVWLRQRAVGASAADLAIEIELLRKHKPATQPLLIQAIGLIPDKKQLRADNEFLLHPIVGPHLLRLVQNGEDTPAMRALFAAKKSRLNELGEFLAATNPRPAGFGGLDEVVALVKLTPSGKGADLEDVTWSVQQATGHGVGAPYIRHLVTRIGEGVTKQDITTRDFGYKEWLFASQTTHVDIRASNTPYVTGGQGHWTGMFEVTVSGVAIEVHNHFVQGGKQYSLHLKDGNLQGRELSAKTDASVYAKISKLCLDRYNAWANGRFDTYTL